MDRFNCRGKIPILALNSHEEISDTPTKHIHHHSRYWLGTCTSIKYGGIKLVLCSQVSSLSEMMWSCMCFVLRNMSCN